MQRMHTSADGGLLCVDTGASHNSEVPLPLLWSLPFFTYLVDEE